MATLLQQLAAYLAKATPPDPPPITNISKS